MYVVSNNIIMFDRQLKMPYFYGSPNYWNAAWINIIDILLLKLYGEIIGIKVAS